MARVRVNPADLDRVVEIINAWSPAAHQEAGTSIDLSSGIGLGRDGHPPVAGTVDGVQEVAANLGKVFSAVVPRRRRQALNALIRSVAPIPTLDQSGQVWSVDSSRSGLAELVFALWLHAGHDPELSRLGTCAGRRCGDAFVDRTRATNRRYCSITCQNRAKVAAFRRRRLASEG